MHRKVFKTGNSTVISFPREYLDALGIDQGSEVNIELDRENNRLTISPVLRYAGPEGVDADFARQVAEFIAEYRPALEELARGS